jgi:hypothetical protein
VTTHKDFKRLVRGRMQKTGESYTAARAKLLTQVEKRKAQSNGANVDSNGHGIAAQLNGSAAAPPKVQPADFAKIAGMSDEKVKEKTGCTWESWVFALDHVEAFNWPHSEIAQYVHEKYKVPGWWTQTVTVGYERIRGLREKGQRRTGVWGASKSKTISAAAGTVFRSFKQPKLRSAWLPNKVVIRTAVPNKSLRITWEDGTSVEVNVVAKGRSKTQVAVEHTKLENRQAADRMKAFWAEHLGELAAKLEPKKMKS